MKDTWVKKGLVVSVILLFIGVAVAPSINNFVVKASNDNDLVEVTSQACGIKGYGDTTVKLTREQYAEVVKLFDDIEMKLKTVKTREEAISIYNNAVVELDTHGLLPKGMNVQQAQRLMTMGYQKDHVITLLKKFSSKSKIINLFCILSVKIKGYPGIENFFSHLGFFFLILSIFLGAPIQDIGFFLIDFAQFKMIRVLNYYFLNNGGTQESFSSFGLFGFVNGTSNLEKIHGFTGLQFYSENGEWNYYLLGSALAITEVY
jgi:hypothetical protein